MTNSCNNQSIILNFTCFCYNPILSNHSHKCCSSLNCTGNCVFLFDANKHNSVIYHILHIPICFNVTVCFYCYYHYMFYCWSRLLKYFPYSYCKVYLYFTTVTVAISSCKHYLFMQTLSSSIFVTHLLICNVYTINFCSNCVHLQWLIVYLKRTLF